MTMPRTETAWIARDIRPGLKNARFGQERLGPKGEEEAQDVALYDTFDGQVAAAGRLVVVTEDGVHLIGASEASQTGGAPGFVADMNEGPVKDALSRIVSPLRKLIPVGEAQLSHQPFAMLDEIDKTLARCDLTVLTAGRDRAITVARMQPLRGYGKAYERLTETIGEIEVPVSPAAATAHLFPEAAGYVSKPAISMPAGMSAFDAANAIIAAHIKVARANETGTIADIDSEFLHDYRVAMRKVRSVVSLFKGVYAPEVTEDLKARFGALMAETGTLRDLDVYLIERDAYIALVPEAVRPGLEMLFDDIASRRDAAQKALAAHLQSEAYLTEIAKLEKLFDKPRKGLAKGPEADHEAHELACKLIWKRYRKVCTIAGSIDETTPDEQVHDLRIHCKKLRYLMEFFAPLFDAGEVKSLIKALKKLQDVLGTFNDCAVQQEALAGLLDATTGQARRKLEIAKSVGALQTVLDQRKARAREQVTASFAAFDAPETRGGFRTLFKRGATT